MTIDWGPFARDLDPAERRARLRTLQALVRVLSGDRGSVVTVALIKAEIGINNATLRDEAAVEFERLGSIDRRRIMSCFAATLPLTSACRPPVLSGDSNTLSKV